MRTLHGGQHYSRVEGNDRQYLRFELLKVFGQALSSVFCMISLSSLRVATQSRRADHLHALRKYAVRLLRLPKVVPNLPAPHIALCCCLQSRRDSHLHALRKYALRLLTLQKPVPNLPAPHIAHCCCLQSRRDSHLHALHKYDNSLLRLSKLVPDLLARHIAQRSWLQSRRADHLHTLRKYAFRPFESMLAMAWLCAKTPVFKAAGPIEAPIFSMVLMA